MAFGSDSLRTLTSIGASLGVRTHKTECDVTHRYRENDQVFNITLTMPICRDERITKENEVRAKVGLHPTQAKTNGTKVVPERNLPEMQPQAGTDNNETVENMDFSPLPTHGPPAQLESESGKMSKSQRKRANKKARDEAARETDAVTTGMELITMSLPGIGEVYVTPDRATALLRASQENGPAKQPQQPQQVHHQEHEVQQPSRAAQPHQQHPATADRSAQPTSRQQQQRPAANGSAPPTSQQQQQPSVPTPATGATKKINQSKTVQGQMYIPICSYCKHAAPCPHSETDDGLSDTSIPQDSGTRNRGEARKEASLPYSKAASHHQPNPDSQRHQKVDPDAQVLKKRPEKKLVKTESDSSDKSKVKQGRIKKEPTALGTKTKDVDRVLEFMDLKAVSPKPDTTVGNKENAVPMMISFIKKEEPLPVYPPGHPQQGQFQKPARRVKKKQKKGIIQIKNDKGEVIEEVDESILDDDDDDLPYHPNGTPLTPGKLFPNSPIKIKDDDQMDTE
jgi:hypothetical protein